ncbi:MAG: acyl-CoA desaturase [Chlamydiae bacterium]|nr:acyl-CoA desaturase [Chlamydiota bacterium]
MFSRLKDYFKDFNWVSGCFIIGYHSLLLALVPLYCYFFTPSWTILTFAFIFYFISGTSITAGYHRFYSHQSYKLNNKFIEFLLLFFGSMATQGSALRWSHDHRIHHAHIDTDKDPYSVKKGFWYAHLFWMFKKQPEIDTKIVSDLCKNKMVMFQENHYLFCMLFANIVPTVLVGWLTGDFFGAFVFVWLFRLFFLHHSTWFINSLAHYWGHQNYSREHSAVDNYIICMLTFGEGYHNYHHTFASDYRNGIRWYHYDPTKWFIWILYKLGFATNLRRTQESRITKQMLLNHKTELLEKLKNSISSKKQDLEEKVSECTDTLVQKMAEIHQLLDLYKEAKKAKVAHVKELYKEIKQLKKILKMKWKELHFLTKSIMRLQPVAMAASA